MSPSVVPSAADRVDPEFWLDQHGDALYRFALIRVQDPHTAEDLVQETLVSGIKSVHSFDGRSSLRTWLFSILKRRIADHARREARQPRPRSQSQDADSEASSHRAHSLLRPSISSETFASEIERKEFLVVLQHCIGELPLHFQEAILLRIADDTISLADLSAKLEITKENLSIRLYRARLYLRACLEQRWLEG